MKSKEELIKESEAESAPAPAKKMTVEQIEFAYKKAIKKATARVANLKEAAAEYADKIKDAEAELERIKGMDPAEYAKELS